MRTAAIAAVTAVAVGLAIGRPAEAPAHYTILKPTQHRSETCLLGVHARFRTVRSRHRLHLVYRIGALPQYGGTEGSNGVAKWKLGHHEAELWWWPAVYAVVYNGVIDQPAEQEIWNWGRRPVRARWRCRLP